MSLINTFAFETVVNQNLMKMNRGGLERIDDGPVKLQDVDCKIKWKDWSEWSACDDGYEYRERTGKIVQLPMGRGSPCPEGDEYTYNYSNGTARQIERRVCSQEENKEEDLGEADDVTEQGEQDGEADDTAEGEEEEEEVNTTTTVSTSGQVEPSCPANSTYDEDEKMCRCDLGYSLDESTGQCNRNTLGFILDAKWWILSAVGAGGAYLYHRSR